MDEEQLSHADMLLELLDTMVEAFALGATVRVEEDGETLRGSVDGPEVERLIGEGGVVIDAIQHLAQRIVLRGSEGFRVVVDAGGYRARREDELREEANRAADAVLGGAREIALAPMPAAERRFVHEHLRARGDVTTHSEGDEPRRRLVVTPL